MTTTSLNIAQQKTLEDYNGHVVSVERDHNNPRTPRAGLYPVIVTMSTGWVVRLGQFGGVMAEHLMDEHFISEDGTTTYSVVGRTSSGVRMEIRCREFGWKVTNNSAHFSNNHLDRMVANGRWLPIKQLPRQICQWFHNCQNPADHMEPHPVLGQVPTCERCGAFIHENS